MGVETRHIQPFNLCEYLNGKFQENIIFYSFPHLFQTTIYLYFINIISFCVMPLIGYEIIILTLINTTYTVFIK
jgi:hypothetical protein